MTVYAKIENNKLITASNNLGITGLADSAELCLANGFSAYTEEEISGYYGGTYQIIDGILRIITAVCRSDCHIIGQVFAIFQLSTI